MAKNKVLFSNLGKTPKDKIINIVILLVLAVILFFGIRWIVRKVKSINTAANKELNTAISSGIKLSYAKSEYDNMAESLYKAMKGFGTDENTIYNVFYRMNTLSDVLQLIVAYGTRGGEDLNEWLKGDLSSSEIAKVNNILTSKGINYTF